MKKQSRQNLLLFVSIFSFLLGVMFIWGYYTLSSLPDESGDVITLIANIFVFSTLGIYALFLGIIFLIFGLSIIIWISIVNKNK